MASVASPSAGSSASDKFGTTDRCRTRPVLIDMESTLVGPARRTQGLAFFYVPVVKPSLIAETSNANASSCDANVVTVNCTKY